MTILTFILKYDIKDRLKPGQSKQNMDSYKLN